MTIQYAGGETRETVHCKDCGTKKRPLKWYDLWSRWMCPRCTEERITAAFSQLT
jgi:predicted Zn-ribbon and HTH transcriptional regulator